MNPTQRLAAWLNRITGLSAVTPVPVGLPNDGLVLRPAGSPLDKDWSTLFAELNDAREAWRSNPLARRLIGLITSYTVGHGITLTTAYPPLQKFIDEFWQANTMPLRIDEWSDELARSGELFPILFTNPISGMSAVRTVPASMIEAIEYDDEDYETELRYKETMPIGTKEKWWMSPLHPSASPAEPVMLHFAVNRPTGAIRGESDLAPILPWLRRYSRWLEDRVRLNAAMRSFLWIVHAPARLRAELQERYRAAPEPGSVIIAEQEAETWEAITPNLHAADAEKDGRAIRWMIVAGGPGTALLDIGEGEDSNLATGQAMSEQRRRFLRRRQSYLTYILTELILLAWQRSMPTRTTHRRPITTTDLHAVVPDISPEDNTDLAQAAAQLTGALTQLAALTGAGPAYRKTALRMFAKFAGETLTESEIDSILAEGESDLESQHQEAIQQHANQITRPPSANATTAGLRPGRLAVRTPQSP